MQAMLMKLEAELNMNRNVSECSAHIPQYGLQVEQPDIWGDTKMDILARRMVIIVLSAMVFAFAMTAMVNSRQRHPPLFHAGTAAPCYHSASTGCVAQ